MKINVFVKTIKNISGNIHLIENGYRKGRQGGK